MREPCQRETYSDSYFPIKNLSEANEGKLLLAGIRIYAFGTILPEVIQVNGFLVIARADKNCNS
jgi:hypothetical protein